QVCENHAAQRPPLEVGALDGTVKSHPRTSACEPHAELDVLDAWSWVARRVETAGGDERVPADRAEARPEGRRLPLRLLVDEVVQQVPEAGHHAGRGRRVVVRAEQGDELRLG